jgi:hypothetical protein
MLSAKFHLIPALWLAAAIVCAGPASAQSKNGTTLAAFKTIDVCAVDTGIWRYSGVLAVYNEGVVATQGLVINDRIQNKTDTTWIDGPVALHSEGEIIPSGTTYATAIMFPYTTDSAALPGLIRNVATITIMNHSGSMGIPKGPEPKATFMGTVAPCVGLITGCSYTQGYWGNKPGVVWPQPYDRASTFYLSAQTWQQVMDTPVNAATGYYQLAHQFIAATLNKANGAGVPAGVQSTLDLAEAWLAANPKEICVGGGTCGAQKTWAKILDTYNNGVYPGGPAHCD